MRSVSLTLALVLVACTDGGKDDTSSIAEDMLYSPCVSTESDAPGDASLPAFGASPMEVFAGLKTAQSGGGNYAEGGPAVTVSAAVEALGTATFVDQEPNPDRGDTGGIEPVFDGCEDFLRIDATLTLTTDDGAFAETMAGTVQVYVAGMTPVGSFSMAAADRAGAWSDPDYQPADWDTLELQVDLGMEAGVGTNGVLTVLGSKTDGETAMQQMEPLVEWTVAP